MLLSGTTKSIDMSPTVLVSLMRRRCRANVPDSARDSTGAPLVWSNFSFGCIEGHTKGSRGVGVRKMWRGSGGSAEGREVRDGPMRSVRSSKLMATPLSEEPKTLTAHG